MGEIIFLFVLALVWIVFATIQDLKSREVANWISFSLVVFALGFRFFYCLFSQETFAFFYQGLIGLGIFFVLGNLFYYGRIFAGGDAKLMMALGAVLPFSENFLVNAKIFGVFFFIFLFIGSFYGLIWSLVLGVKNFKEFKKEFFKRLKKKRKLVSSIAVLGLCIMFLGFVDNLLFFLGALIFILPYFYTYAKSVDEVCMVKKIKTSQLTEGDWLYKNVRVGKKLIKSNWDGVTKEEIKEIKKRRKIVMIRQGIAFVPVFLISFLILLYLLKKEFWFFWF